jgi:hypothetical protein
VIDIFIISYFAPLGKGDASLGLSLGARNWLLNRYLCGWVSFGKSLEPNCQNALDIQLTDNVLSGLRELFLKIKTAYG